jgi:hypothetical protein
VVKAVADLVREMNSYYSNLIEGLKTTPREIGRALHNVKTQSGRTYWIIPGMLRGFPGGRRT